MSAASSRSGKSFSVLDWKRGDTRAHCPFRTSPGSRRFPGDHSEVLAQMRLIYKSTSKRNVAQRHIGLKHVLGSQSDATPDHKGVG
jgi:hypothetical protein